VQISRPEKELFPSTDQPAVTKADLAEYYSRVASVMLPHVRRRPISMQRFPDGIEGGSFYEKRELLDELGLASVLKTTGSRGYHVVVPLQPRPDFETVRTFARSVAEVLVARRPELLTLEARKDNRGERVLVDIQRNAYAQTAVPPYAVRARPGAPVATPIRWDELSRVAPDTHTIDSICRRLGQATDPWAGFEDHRQDLTAAAQHLQSLST